MEIDELTTRLFPVWVSFGSRMITFARATNADLDALTFHDQRSLPFDCRAPIDGLAEVVAALPPRPRPRYVFQTAFCGSTLLGKLLRGLGTRVYLEPSIATRLLWGRSEPLWRPAVGVIETLLASRSPQPTVAKLHNQCGALWSALTGDHPALLLWNDLETFLVKMARLRREVPTWTRDQLTGYPDRDCLRGARLELAHLGDEQCDALLWASQVEDYRSDPAFPGQTRTIRDATLFTNPAGVARAAARWLGLGAADDAALDRVAGVHAKSGRPFDADAERAERADILQAHGAEIHDAMRWLEGFYDIPDLAAHALAC